MSRIPAPLFLLVISLPLAFNTYAQTLPTIKLVPQMRQVTLSLEKAPSSLLEQQRNQRSVIITQQQIQQAPRVLGLNHGKHYITADERLFISGEQTQVLWGIYHPTQVFQQGERQWVQLQAVAWAKLQETSNVMSRLQITHLLQEVRVDDIALPLTQIERNE